MSDTFDPDAWPHSPGSAGPRAGNGGGGGRKDDEDDYDSMSFDNPQQPGYGDDDYDGYGFDYDDEPAPAPGPAPRGSGATSVSSGRADYDDYDDEYDDDGYDDGYDDFDREPRSGGAMRKIVGIAAAVLILGAIGLLASNALSGGGEDTATEDETEDTVPGEDEDGGTDTTVAGEEEVPAPDAVNSAMDKAFEAWGKFAVAGDLDAVRPYFVTSGPQYARLEAEAKEISAHPPGGEPLQMSMTGAKAVKVDNNTWLVRGNVEVSRTGERSQSYPWELRMMRQNDKQPWQIFSVRQT